MDFDFTDDQEQLRDAVRKWVDKGYDFERRRSIARAGGFSREAYGQLAELGLTGLFISEDDGGMGMGPVEGMVVMEELGRGIVLEPLAQTLIAGAVLSGYAPADVKAAWLPKIAGGEALVVLASQERAARYKLDVCEAKAAQIGVGWALTATKSIVPVGDMADAFIVPARVTGAGRADSDAAGISVFVVRAADGRINAYPTQDGGRAADVRLVATPAQLITHDAYALLETAVDVGVAAHCAEAVGLMDRLVAITVDYMNTRKQFGSTLAGFQALRHRMADVKMQLELGRSLSYFASLKLSEPAPQRRRAVAQARVQLGHSMRFVGQQCIQLHGGIACTDEYIASHYFKRLTMLEFGFGDTLHHLGEVSSRMQDTAGVFA